MENIIKILTTEITVPFWYCLLVITYCFRNIFLAFIGFEYIKKD